MAHRCLKSLSSPQQHCVSCMMLKDVYITSFCTSIMSNLKSNWPQRPSTEVVVVVVVVVMARCFRWDWSRVEVSREPSDAVLLFWTTLLLLLLLLTGVLTAEKERVFLGVAAWLRDKDRPELDCGFLLRSVLKEQMGKHRGVSFVYTYHFSPRRWWCLQYWTTGTTDFWCEN